MKAKLYLFVVIIFMVLPLTSTAKIVIDNFCNNPQDSIETREVHLQSIKRLEVSDGIKVEVIQSAENKAIVSSNHADYVMMDRRGHRLRIYYYSYKKDAVLCKPQTTVKLYAKNIKRYIAKKGAEVVLKSPVSRSSARIYLFSRAKMEGVLKVKKARIIMKDKAQAKLQFKSKIVKIKVHGGINLVMSGKSNWLKIVAAKTSKIDAKDFIAKKARVQGESSSHIEVKALRLNVKAAGASNVLYEVPSQSKLWHIKAKQKKGGRVARLGGK